MFTLIAAVVITGAELVSLDVELCCMVELIIFFVTILLALQVMWSESCLAAKGNFSSFLVYVSVVLVAGAKTMSATSG